MEALQPNEYGEAGQYQWTMEWKPGKVYKTEPSVCLQPEKHDNNYCYCYSKVCWGSNKDRTIIQLQGEMNTISCCIYSLGALWEHDFNDTVIKEDLNNRKFKKMCWGG